MISVLAAIVISSPGRQKPSYATAAMWGVVICYMVTNVSEETVASIFRFPFTIGMWGVVICYMITNVSEETAASIFRFPFTIGM
jgi:hypothetical protein